MSNKTKSDRAIKFWNFINKYDSKDRLWQLTHRKYIKSRRAARP